MESSTGQEATPGESAQAESFAEPGESAQAGSFVEPAEVFEPGSGAASFRLIDVRAPVEVSRGALPAAVNLPILSDEERRQVGIRYKEAGQEAAVRLGFELTAADMPRRVAAWRENCSQGPAALVCWRGGLRSQLAQQFIASSSVPRVRGGYRALRAHLVAGMAEALGRKQTFVLTGMTGTGKTDLIESLANEDAVLPLDLERLANHRGSAFGAVGRQPPQQTFENELAARVLLSPARSLVVEDESRRIGSLHLPDAVHSRIAGSPVLVLEADEEERISRIHRQYVVYPVERLGRDAALGALVRATSRLRPRLGSKLTDELLRVLEHARQADLWRDRETMSRFIAPLLKEYYDPLYRRAIGRMERVTLVRGSGEELREWLRLNA